jgi:BolA protein
MSGSDDRTEIIKRRLETVLEAEHVEVVDDSASHASHPGARSGGGHYRVLVVSPRFTGLSRVSAQRLVYQALDELMDGDIHALEMQTLVPEQWRPSDS